MDRFNDSDIGYVDPEWQTNPELKHGNKERTIHEIGNGDTQKEIPIQTPKMRGRS